MKCFKIILALVLMTCILTQEVDMEKLLYEKFQRFMKKWEKNYDSLEEFNKRFEIFKNNYYATHPKKVDVQSTEQDDDEAMKIGTTQFSDMTEEEFRQTFLTLKQEELPKESEMEKFLEEKEPQITEDGRNLQYLPASFDWRLKGVVTTPKTQGGCGGCWAFTASGNIEGLYAIKHKRLISFSEQQMLDCDNGNSGCAGGIMHAAYNYLRNAGGLMASSSYPWKGYKSLCRFNPALAIAKVTSYTFSPSNNENTIMSFLYSRGPLGITMNANTLQFYRGGVINVPYSNCPYSPNHGVLLVGWGTTSTGIPYWIIKNSWGPYWGEGGYFRIARNRGLCGVNQYVITANIA